MPFDLITGAAISLPSVQQEQQEEDTDIEFKRLVVVNKSKSKSKHVSRFVRMHKRKTRRRRVVTNRRLLKMACILLACIHKSLNGCRQA